MLAVVGSALAVATVTGLAWGESGTAFLLPLALATWTLVHASGVHATVAGVLLGFTVPYHATR